MSERALRNAASRGAKLLDEKLPGWAERIDLDRLDMLSAVFYLDPTHVHHCGCIISQLAPESNCFLDGEPRRLYSDGMRTLLGMEPTSPEAARYGFLAPSAYAETESNGPANPNTSAEYDTLTRFWRAEVEKRRAHAQ